MFSLLPLPLGVTPSRKKLPYRLHLLTVVSELKRGDRNAPLIQFISSNLHSTKTFLEHLQYQVSRTRQAGATCFIF